MDVSAALTRDNAAQMVWNALQAKEVKFEYTLVSENGQLVSKPTLVEKDITLLEDKYDATITTGVVINVDYNSKGYTVQIQTGLACDLSKLRPTWLESPSRPCTKTPMRCTAFMSITATGGTTWVIWIFHHGPASCCQS